MWFRLAVAALAAVGIGPSTDTVVKATPLTLTIVARYPHDPKSFTEGLLVDHGTVYESSGLYGASDVRVADLLSGEIRLRQPTAPTIFGEGLARVGNELIQLSWREGQALFYDAATLQPTRTATYTGEGWGLCFDGTRLLMSDGSATITGRDPHNLAPLSTFEVRRDGQPVLNINELECDGTTLWANVWLTREILRIDPTDGTVTGVLDATPLLTEEQWAALQGDAVLNGIAIDETGRMFVTGKWWPTLYEISVSG